MPKRKIQFVPGEYYHIGNRGAGRQSVFVNEQDDRHVIQLMLVAQQKSTYERQSLTQSVPALGTNRSSATRKR